MNSFFDVRFFGEAFVTLIVITDPPGLVPVFLALTKGYPEKQRQRMARTAATVAFGVIAGFAVFGRVVLDYLGVTVPALQLAGGLLLLLVALDLLMGRAGPTDELGDRNLNVAMVPLGTPLLAGPGAIVAAIVFVQRADGAEPKIASLCAAIVAVVLVLWATMRFSVVINRIIKENGVELVSRIAGLLLAAIAVQLSADAVRSFIEAG
ncbi:MarC family protein [Actinocorallia lasiicapitis]